MIMLIVCPSCLGDSFDVIGNTDTTRCTNCGGCYWMLLNEQQLDEIRAEQDRWESEGGR